MIAAGTGIVPIYSLLQQLLVQEKKSRLTLIYSNHRQSDTVFYDELLVWQQRFFNRLGIELLFSDHQQILRARLSSTSLKMLLDRHLHSHKKAALLYTCGPYDFMQMVQIVALTYGFSANHIRKEIFSPPDSVITQPVHITTTDRCITLHKGGNTFQLFVPYQQSILTAALLTGIKLPYSCRAGRCSSCQAKVIRGRVQMHYNEVLTDADEANGYMLTCTGHPMTDDVVIEVKG